MSNPHPVCKFPAKHDKPMAKKIIGVRLPVDVDTAVRELAGDELSDWIREAIAEKLEREQQVSA